jgi:hypothetical protein
MPWMHPFIGPSILNDPVGAAKQGRKHPISIKTRCRNISRRKVRRYALRKDMEKRKRCWFRANVETATEFVTREFAEWKKSAK